MILTYQYRIKDSNSRNILNRMTSSVNYVWNYCNETSIKAIKRDHKFLSGYDLSCLTSGSSIVLGLHSQTIQSVCEEYALRRKQFHKAKLNWRTVKRQPGWIPFKKSSIKVTSDTVTYRKQVLKFYNSRSIPTDVKIKSGSFTSDKRGRWYVNISFEVPTPERCKVIQPEIGIDLGLKTTMTLSDGTKYDKPRHYRLSECKLAMAQRAHKKRQVKSISARIANQRKDWIHKTTTEIIKAHSVIRVGNVSSSKLIKTHLSKSVHDASWSMAKTFFEYKAAKLGKVFEEVNEAWSSCTCSACFQRTGPSGLSQLDVREWICSNCGVVHDRDINAAKNILINSPFGTSKAVSGILRF